MMSRPHPRWGWLYVSRPDWNRTMEQCLRFRDEADDPHASGQPAAYVEWVQSVEAPQLAARYRAQFLAQIEVWRGDLLRLQASIDAGRLDLLPAADAIEADLTLLEALVA